MGSKISVIVIMKNEESNIKDFLESVERFADEIIINDTGSTDRSIELAKAHEKVYLFESEWRDDFAYSRNLCLPYCSGDFIVWLDLDDRIDENGAKQIKKNAMEFDDKSIFLFLISSVMDENENCVHAYQYRMFPNYKNIRFESPIHEHIVVEEELDTYMCNSVTVKHLGYKDKDLEQKKVRRNINILNKIEDSFHKFYHLGVSNAIIGDKASSFKYFELAYDIARNDSERETCALNIARIHIENDNLDEAEKWINTIKTQSVMSYFAKAQILLKKGDYVSAYKTCVTICEMPFEIDGFGIPYDSIIASVKRYIDLCDRVTREASCN